MFTLNCRVAQNILNFDTTCNMDKLETNVIAQNVTAPFNRDEGKK